MVSEREEPPSKEADTVPAALHRASAQFPDAIALADGEVELSYRGLHERARTFARALIARGVAHGEKVAIYAPNTHHWVVAALGTLYCGAALVPINTRYTSAEAVDLLARTEARVLVATGGFLGTDRIAGITAAAGADGLPALATIVRVPVEGPEPPREGVLEWAELDRVAAAVPLGEVEARAAAVSGEDVSDILFTSGTTGRSKGAMSAHRQALGVARAWAACTGLTSADRYLVINPFFHTFGYKAGILPCLLTGATIVPMAVFDIETMLETVATRKISVLPGAPTIYQTMLSHPDRDRYELSSLRLAVTGAAIVPVALVERMQTELSFEGVVTAYGLTEAVVATMCRLGDDPATVSQTSGRATAGFEVAISDGHGGALPPGEPGEILLRGPNVMLGYLDDPEATAAAITPEGWLHTGDIGTLDAAGNLAITDRLKDMYTCGGFNVYPAEIEQTLARLTGVTDQAVIGVPDERMGEVGKAILVTRPDAALTEADVIAYCRAHLANFKVPRQVDFVEALPRNQSGKILKRELRGREHTS
jgi:acyl-CoA synthetase (AMP-forming)/AMP-acid ligase II